MTTLERVYEPRGGAREIFRARDAEVVLSGPAGTGKTRAVLEKLNALALKYPRSRQLIIRKTRESLTEAALVTFEDHVRPPIDTGSVQRRMRQAYRYPNGSEIIVAGIDKPGKVMSTEFDTIYVQEAIDLTLEDWESLSSRLRNGVIPYQQLIGDTNPGPPSHWLKRRADAGALRLIPCRHEDNPRIVHPVTGDVTAYGRTYLERLDRLTGVRLKRLRHGLWVAAEGMVYDEWDALVHHTTLADLGLDRVPSSWRRYRAIDFGFTNPFVCQWWAVDPDGRMLLYREIYRTRTLVEDHARVIRALEASAGERIDATITDHDAEDRATLERHLACRTTPADKNVSAGIQDVQARLRRAGDGRARLHVLKGALVERDLELEEAGRPTCTAEEVDAYVWDERREAPVKANDHGMDPMRYMARFLDARAPRRASTAASGANRATTMPASSFRGTS